MVACSQYEDKKEALAEYPECLSQTEDWVHEHACLYSFWGCYVPCGGHRMRLVSPAHDAVYTGSPPTYADEILRLH